MFRFRNYSKALKWLAALAVVVAVVVSTSKQLRKTEARGDVEVYVHAARVLLAGQDLYTTPEPRGQLYYVYPPLLAVLFIPLVYLPFPLVVVLWCVLNVALVAWVVTAFYGAMTGERFSELEPEARWVMGFFPVLLSARAILYHLDLAQANILVMAVAVLGLKLLRGHREAAAGLAIGLSIVLKVITLPLAVFFLARGRVRVVAGVAVGGLVGLLLPALGLGLERNVSYVWRWLTEVVLATDLGDSRHWPLNFNYSLAAQLYRFFGGVPAFEYEGRFYSVTLLRLPARALDVASKLIPLLTALVIAIYARRYRERSELVGLWGGVALAFCMVPVFSTIAHKHYYVVLLPAHVYVVYVWYCLRLGDRWFRGLVIASFVLATLSTNLFGYLPGVVVGNLGGLVWGALLLAAAIFRAAERVDYAPVMRS